MPLQLSGLMLPPLPFIKTVAIATEIMDCRVAESKISSSTVDNLEHHITYTVLLE